MQQRLAASTHANPQVAGSSLLDIRSPVVDADGDESNLRWVQMRTGIVELLLEI